MPYLRITNIDITQDSAWYYALLPDYNRKVNEVSEWKDPIPIINSSGSGIYTNANGDFTFFRRNKVTGKIDFRNCYINCELSTNVVFVVGLVLPTTDGFNFRVAIQLTELGNNPLENFEYGYSVNGGAGAEIVNWQDLNTFNLIDEGTYFFDVRLKNQIQTVGVQSIELTLNQDDSSNFGGGDESDNTQPGTGSSED